MCVVENKIDNVIFDAEMEDFKEQGKRNRKNRRARW